MNTDINRTALIGNIQKFSTEDGPGIRSSVFLKGCPLNCKWCHNPEMIRPEQQMILSPSRCIHCMACVEICPENAISVNEDGPNILWDRCTACGACAGECYAKAISPVGREMSVAEVMAEVVQDKDFYDQSGGGVTISGGEVLMHTGFAKELIDACREEGIRICLDTSGQGTYENLYQLASAENIQHILFDIKHMNPDKHREYMGTDNSLILSNLRKLAADPAIRCKLWMRMPLVKGVNDDDEAIHAAKALYEELNLKTVTLIGYHELGTAKARHIGMDCHVFQPPTDERMLEIKKAFASIGMKVEILGFEDTED